MKIVKDFLYKVSCLIRYSFIFDEGFYGRLRRSVWMAKSTSGINPNNEDRITFSESKAHNIDAVVNQSEKEITVTLPIMDKDRMRSFQLKLIEENYSSDYLCLFKRIVILSIVDENSEILWTYSDTTTMTSNSFKTQLGEISRSEAVRYYDLLRDKINS